MQTAKPTRSKTRSQWRHSRGATSSSAGRLVGLTYTCALISLIGQLPAGSYAQLDEETTTGSSPASFVPVTIAPNVVHFEPTASPANASKLKPVNFTLVDEVFAATLDEEELVKRWKNMDAQFQDGIRSILKLVFPQIVAISQDAKVSGDCSGGILKWILSLRNLRSWAIKSKFGFMNYL